MKKLFITFLFFVSLLAVHAQKVPGPRLVVRGDDMGASHSINLACMESSKKGIQTSIEVMVICPWFPEAVRLLRENPAFDAGVHLTITSEWENYKWRPITQCPSLVDNNGYFFPKISPDKNYPGLSVSENRWNLDEIEREFRAQIELGLKNIPQLSHISAHMGSTGFDVKVAEMTHKLADEYKLADISSDPKADYGLIRTTYDGPHRTLEEKETSFIKMLNSLEAGKTYFFVDHPAYDNIEMQPLYFTGNLEVAMDRQGVTDLYKDEKVKAVINEKGIQLITYNEATKSLLRSTPEKEGISSKAISNYLDGVKKSGQDLHSFMILRHGKVAAEQWFGDNAPGKNHIMNSVSKTFTSTAIGFAVTEDRIKVTDKVISFFPDDLPETISPYLAELQIRDLLTMSVGHDVDPTAEIRAKDGSWERMFLAKPIENKPGTKFVYNSLASYMLCAIVQKVTGEKVIDYLYPRLFRPLGINGAEWLTSPTGVNTGGWGLFIKTEDMAKLGQFYLQKGKWEGKQLLPESWFDEATSAKITQPAVWVKAGTKPEDSDYLQGYCYQMWRCRHNAFRADGANGQFIIVLPDKDAVIVLTANITDMQSELNLVWKYLLPALK
jgi:CubicO group peptidase (beta-lactamase class C family)/predicted glycoside hydrolase/deacetylase ChbG (UPF0249 family)